MTDRDAPRPADGETPVKQPSSDPKSSDFGSGDGYSGDEYDAADHAAERHLQRDEQAKSPAATDATDATDGRDIPSETGKRASFDRATGEVHGSGSSAGGGGNPNEDIDLDTARSGPADH